LFLKVPFRGFRGAVKRFKKSPQFRNFPREKTNPPFSQRRDLSFNKQCET